MDIFFVFQVSLREIMCNDNMFPIKLGIQLLNSLRPSDACMRR